MRLTNKYNLPKTIINAIERDPYSMGDARMSVTGLLRPPRITLLHKRHYNDIVADVTDYIWSLHGRAIHHILETGGDEEHVTEERLFATVRGWRISGACDLQRKADGTRDIVDYKNVSAFALRSDKVEWEQQLNLYDWLASTSLGVRITGLSICAFIRDWNRHKAKQDASYPQAPAQVVPVRQWTKQQQLEFVTERVRLHQEALATEALGEELPECTAAERWEKADTYQVWRDGNHRYTKSFPTYDEADAWCKGRETTYSICRKPGTPVRCANNFCQVAPWCSQYQRKLRE